MGDFHVGHLDEGVRELLGVGESHRTIGIHHRSALHADASST
jgi:hypothetical protein